LTLSAGTDATMRNFVQSNTLGTTRTLTWHREHRGHTRLEVHALAHAPQTPNERLHTTLVVHTKHRRRVTR
jgi:hypothetical protein